MSFVYGKTVYPIPRVTSGATLLPACDPALAKLLDFLAYMIRTYADDVIGSVASVRTPEAPTLPVESTISQIAPIDPETIAKAEQFQFPLFCGWRKSTVYNKKTLNWTADTSKVGLAYILPPLTASQAIQVTSLLTSVSQICNYAFNAGHDDGYNGDERIIAENGITSARLLTADFGSFDFAGNAKPPYFPAWVAELELVEQSLSHTGDLPLLEGTDFVVTQQSTDAATPVEIVVAKSEVG